jgi:hypothetical protein
MKEDLWLGVAVFMTFCVIMPLIMVLSEMSK